VLAKAARGHQRQLQIEINIENLAQVDEQILVSQLKTPAGCQILSGPEQVVVKIGELISKEAQEQAAEEAAAAEAAKEEGAEGEQTEAAKEEGAEGEQKEEATEDKSQDDKKTE